MSQFISRRTKGIISRCSPYLFILFLAIIMVHGIWLDHVFWGGLDADFHMNQIYEDARQIKTGHFSYFLSLFGFNQAGRIVNTLYAPLFSYLCGYGLLLCGNWIRFEALLFIITLVIGGVGVYLLSQMVKLGRVISLAIAMLYMIIHPILISWVGNFEFTGLGALLMPYAFMMGLYIIQKRRIPIIGLALLMTLYLQIHLMTSLIVVGVLVVPFLINFIRSSHRGLVVLKSSIAVILTILLNGNIFGALWDVFSSNHLIPTIPSFNLQTPNGKAIGWVGHSFSILGTVYSGLIGIVILYLIWKLWNHSFQILDIWLFSEFFLFFIIASSWFPWNRIGQIFPKVFSIIQFPQRFSSVIFLSLLLLTGRCLFQVSKQFRWRDYDMTVVVIIFLVMMIIPAVRSTSEFTAMWRRPRVVWYSNNSHAIHYFNHHSGNIRSNLRNHDLSRGIQTVQKVTPDYLPTSHKIILSDYYHLPIDIDYQRIFYYNRRVFHKQVIHRNTLLVTWSSHSHQKITPPVVFYQHTLVSLNHHRIRPHLGLIGISQFHSVKGHNCLTLRYQPGLGFEIMVSLMLISWLILLMMGIKKMIYFSLNKNEGNV